MSLIEKIKRIKAVKLVILTLKKAKGRNKHRRQFRYHGSFADRSKGREKLCVILAGYKPYIYEDVFDRTKKVLTDDIDVCVVTSGLFSAEIDEMCRNNDWSYLSTHENNVGLVQNIAIKLHPRARYIYKLDEDIFVTRNYFDNLMKALLHAKNGDYEPGIVAPIIPLNGYGYCRVLDKLNLRDEFIKRFGKIRIGASETIEKKALIESSGEAAMFFWGKDGIVPSIDEMNDAFSKGTTEEYPCPFRFSIGAILFERSFWEEMGYYDVDLLRNSMGKDEEQICAYCLLSSRPIMVSENVVVGHLSFGPQNEAMTEYYHTHRDLFGMK